MIELHSTPTPNGQKVMLMLEETGLEWKHVDVNIRTGDQFKPEHLRLSPNNKIPAIIDSEGPGGGPYTMMESGAILWYLAEKTGKFLPKDARKRYDTLQWLMFQMAHIGPMFGQANHFNSYALDYLSLAEIKRHSSWQTFQEAQAGRLVLLTTKAALSYTAFAFDTADTLVLGRESAGVPDFVDEAAGARIRIPMRPGLRSINVAQAGAMVLGEGLRQTKGFPA